MMEEEDISPEMEPVPEPLTSWPSSDDFETRAMMIDTLFSLQCEKTLSPEICREQIKSAGHWLAQIRLSEAAGNHVVSNAFFFLGFQLDCRPRALFRDEFCSYVRRYSLDSRVTFLGNQELRFCHLERMSKEPFYSGPNVYSRAGITSLQKHMSPIWDLESPPSCAIVCCESMAAPTLGGSYSSNLALMLKSAYYWVSQVKICECAGERRVAEQLLNLADYANCQPAVEMVDLKRFQYSP